MADSGHGNGRGRIARLTSGSIAPLVVVFVLLAISGLSYTFRGGSKAENQAAIAEAEEFRLLEIRGELARLHYDLLTDSLLAEIRGSQPSEANLAAFQELRAAAIDELRELSERESDVGILARALVNDLSFSDYRTWPYEAMNLEDDHYFSLEPDLDVGADGDDRLLDRLHLAMLPRLVLADALVVELSHRDLEVPAWASGYVDYVFDGIVNYPGWMGPNGDQPLRGNFVSDDRTTPDELAGNPDLYMVWQYDQWIIEHGANPEAPPSPLSIDELQSAAVAASVLLDSFALEPIQRERQAALARIVPVRGPVLLVVSALSAVAALAVLALLLWKRRRLHQSLADAVHTDPLTGARNRRYLDAELADRCQRRHTHHVVVMIDLDRFKMVNDTWGHDVGDRMLVTTCQRLQAAVDELCGRWAEGSGTVVRLGGDEFAVLLQSPDRFNLGLVAERFRAVSGRIDVGRDLTVELELSIGIADAAQPVDIHDLLKSADLATYEDKRARKHSAAGDDRVGSLDDQPLGVDLR